MMTLKFVLDTSGIIRSSLDFTAGSYVTSSSVLSELSDYKAREAVEYGIRIGRISLKEPEEAARKVVREAAAASGDLKVLSGADLDVLALAWEHKIPVISDDYAVQNTAAHLGIEFKATFHEGIKRKVSWRFLCSGCGREYDAKTVVCSVCGSKVKRTG